jgi:CDP-4-dehydro-6-deoxyglucose reductase, E1
MNELTASSKQFGIDYYYPTAFSCWGDDEHDAIQRVVQSGRFTMGPEVEQFEHEFADFHGMKHGVMVNSGSSANLIMIATLVTMGLIKQNDQVLVPALAWSTTYAPLIQYGLRPILVDCDDTWNADYFSGNFDPQDAKLIVVCSILGNPARLAELATIASSVGAIMIEDNCESLGASPGLGRLVPKQKLCGTFGLMNSFSFFHSHQISAIEGGMILTDDDDCAKMARMLRNHGWSRDIEKPTSFDNEYDFRVFGYNLRPLEMHAAIARAQLAKLNQNRQLRYDNLVLFEKLVADFDVPIVTPVINGRPSPFGLQFTVENQRKRSKLASALRAEGIDCRLPTGGSFTKHKYGERWIEQQTPVVDTIHLNGMFIGNGPLNLNDGIVRAVQIMAKTL